jgi:hypothetical protein
VDGDAFSQGEYDGIFWRALQNHPAITDSLLSSNSDYVDASLAQAYGGSMSEYHRQYLFLAPDVLIVRDDLHAMQPHVFTWLMHVAENAVVNASGTTARIAARDAIADMTAGGTASWEICHTPAPAAISQYLGNILLHPGEKKPAQRYVLRLSSKKSTSTQFEVAMQFRLGTDAASRLEPVSQPNASGFSGDVWALFRNAPRGDLRFGNLASDGSVFAGRSPQQWMTIGARSVRDGGQTLLTATAAVNAGWSRSQQGIMLDLHLDTPATITVGSSGKAISVDGAPVTYREKNGRIELRSLAKGEHHVRISS